MIIRKPTIKHLRGIVGKRVRVDYHSFDEFFDIEGQVTHSMGKWIKVFDGETEHIITTRCILFIECFEKRRKRPEEGGRGA